MTIPTKLTKLNKPSKLDILLGGLSNDPMLRVPDVDANSQTNPEAYRMSISADGVRTMERFDNDSFVHGKHIETPEWALRVWALAEMGGFVMSSAIMPRRVVWLTRYGPPRNEVVVHNYTTGDGEDLHMPMENLYDHPDVPD